MAHFDGDSDGAASLARKLRGLIGALVSDVGLFVLRRLPPPSDEFVITARIAVPH